MTWRGSVPKFDEYGIDYWRGSGHVVFEARREDKRGTVRVNLLVDPADILRIADAIRPFPPEEYGHAIYHMQRPELPLPCSTCSPAAVKNLRSKPSKRHP